jgi:hypothetical protein
MNSVANEMLERIGNKKISESFAMPITIERDAENPKYHYLKYCKKERDLDLPLPAKI